LAFKASKLHFQLHLRGRPEDLSNMKLPQNQTELTKQIEDLLAAIIENQGRMLQRLMEENTKKRTDDGGG
jgi:hypothetical protein